MFLRKYFTVFFVLLLSYTSFLNAATLRYATSGDAISMEPYKAYEAITIAFLSNIYEPLVMRNEKLDFVPGLAVKWENTSPTVWRFHLRKGVKFHGGEDFTADDALFSIKRAQHELSDFKSSIASVKHVRKVDDHTIDIETHNPDPILPNEIYSIAMMSKSWCEQHGAVTPHNVTMPGVHFTDLHTNGTGPYILKDRQPDTKTVLVKNILWWGDAANLIDEVVYRPIPSGSTRIAALLAGDVDLIGQVPLQDIDRVKRSQFNVFQTPGTRTIFLGLDVTSDKILGKENPLKNVDVRRAMHMAIDLQGLHKKIMAGYSTPAGTYVAPNVDGYNAQNDKPVKYDIEGAKALMKKAGFEQGFTLPMECPNDRYVNDEKLCAAAASMLSKIGIHVQLKAKPKSVYFGDVMKHAPAIFMLGWAPTTGDAHDTYHSLLGKGGFNWGRYKNDAFNALVDAAHKELDAEKRQTIFDQLETIARDDVPYLPLHHENVIWAARPGLTIKQKANDYIYVPYISLN